MLRDADVSTFVDKLPGSVKHALPIIGRKEQWPMDDIHDVHAAIEQLSTLLAEDSTVLQMGSNSSSLSSMALMKLPRALMLLTFILQVKPNFVTDILQDPGITGRDAIHKLIMINRLVFLVRTNLIESIFSEQNCMLVKTQLQKEVL